MKEYAVLFTLHRRNRTVRYFVRILSVLILAGVLAVTATRVLAAVTVSSFEAHWQGTSVQVVWTTGSEYNNVGFNILRGTSEGGTFTKLNSNVIPSQCLGCVGGANYVFGDSAVAAGQGYYYKLQALDQNGGGDTFGPIAVSGAAATSTPTATQPPPTAIKTATPTRTRTRTATVAATRTSNTAVPTTVAPTRTATDIFSATPTTPAPTATVTVAQPTGEPSIPADPTIRVEPTIRVDPAVRQSATDTVPPPAAPSLPVFTPSAQSTRVASASFSPTAPRTRVALGATKTAPAARASTQEPSAAPTLAVSPIGIQDLGLTAGLVVLGGMGLVTFVGLVGFLFLYLRRFS